MEKNYILINEVNHNFKSNDFYVYELHNPINNQPFYIGKGVETRAQRHISLRKNQKIHNTNPHKSNTINQIIDSGYKVIIKIVSTHSTEEDAFLIEQSLIQTYGRRCDNSGILTNITTGGDGYTQDGKSIDQYTMWGDFIQKHKNAKEAMRLNGWKNYSIINGCCTGKERSYKGFLWCYSGEQPKILTRVKPVYQWTLAGEFVNVYRNVSSASRELSCDSSSIAECAKGNTRQSAGFLWTYTKIQPILTPNKQTKSVLHINTGILYPSVTTAAIATNHGISTVSTCCKRGTSISGDSFCYWTPCEVDQCVLIE